MRAGLIGAVAATVVGTLANDSGALLLEIGSRLPARLRRLRLGERVRVADAPSALWAIIYP